MLSQPTLPKAIGPSACITNEGGRIKHTCPQDVLRTWAKSKEEPKETEKEKKKQSKGNGENRKVPDQFLRAVTKNEMLLLSLLLNHFLVT